MQLEKDQCFHCGLPVPGGLDCQVEVDGEPRDMCCAGCAAVAQSIVENGLTDFYRHRTIVSDRPEDLIPQELQVYDNDQLQKTFVRYDDDSEVREASLILEGIVCAACVWLNEKHVGQLPGVLSFRVNYTTHRASLRWDNSQTKLSDVLQAIAAIGYHAHPFDPGRLEAIQKKERTRSLRRIGIAAVGMMQVMMLAIALYLGDAEGMSESMENFLRWASLVITTPVVLFASSAFFTSAWKDLKQKRLGMDLPVSLAIIAAFSASVWGTVSQSGEVYFDSVNMFTFFLLVGRFLEMEARHKAGQVAEALVRLLPDVATRLRDGAEEIIPANELALKDLVRVKAGEVVPADGEVLEGVSSVNESLLTGESLPVSKQQGSELIGGTVNVESPLLMRVTKLGDSTVLSAISRLLDQAQTAKPHIAKFADNIAAKFVVALLLLAISMFAFWATQVGMSHAFWITLSVLVVSCPCALSLATPVAVTAATGELTKRGMLTTKGYALETLVKVDRVVFDKTGTLTHGNLLLGEKKLLSDISEQRCDQVASALSSLSEHPVAKPLQHLSKIDVPKVDDYKITTGKGVEAMIEGVRYRLGNSTYITEWHPDQDVYDEDALGSQVLLADANKVLALFLLVDEVRNESVQAIRQLMDKGINVSLLSGDHKRYVKHVATSLGITDYYGGLLPEDKLNQLQRWQDAGEIVAMVGDGVNDAPVLAKAQVSIAMGKGSQLAQASADMVLLSENLLHIPESVHDAKRMQRIIHQNFMWAIGYNLVAIPFAASGVLAPWMAAIGMSASSLVVVLNALRLKGASIPKRVQ